MKKESFFAEALRAVVEYRRKKARTAPTEYYLNQKNQLWYMLMNAVDEDNQTEAAAAPAEKKD